MRPGKHSGLCGGSMRCQCRKAGSARQREAAPRLASAASALTCLRPDPHGAPSAVVAPRVAHGFASGGRPERSWELRSREAPADPPRERSGLWGLNFDGVPVTTSL